MQGHTPAENIRFLIETTFASDLVNPKDLYDPRMSSVGVFPIRDIHAWTWYMYQLSINNAVNSGVTDVKIAYGDGDSVVQLVRRPSFATFVKISRDVTIPSVVHPSNVVEGSSLIPFPPPKMEIDDDADDADDR